MRMRHKAYARPELEGCPFFIPDPERWRGRWQQAFDEQRPLILELGCGKGAYAAAYASARPEINYLAVDYLSDVLVLAKRKVEQAYADAGRPVNNCRLTALNIQ